MITVHILHAGISHASPYFYNFCKYLDKYNDFEYVINPELPEESPIDTGIIYFNRLKRFYDSKDMNTAKSFIKKIKFKKNQGWKIAMTLHNFFPIDRSITEVDEYITREFLNECDLVFTLSENLKKSIKTNYGIKAINHGMGFNELDGPFDNDLIKKIKKDKFVFTFIGNIYPYKMLNKIINEFNKLEGACLIVAGEEPKNSHVNIESLVNNNTNIIFYNGFVGKHDWIKLSEITDVFVSLYDLDLKSFKYGFFPSNYINIYNTGIPCISPRHEAIMEMMDEEQMIYYNFYDEDGLLKAMNYAMNNEIKRLKNNVYKRYSWYNQIEIFTKYCRGIYED